MTHADMIKSGWIEEVYCLVSPGNAVSRNAPVDHLRFVPFEVTFSEQFDLAGCHVGPGNNFDAGRQTAFVCRCRDYPAPAKSEILHTLPQPGDSIVVDRSAEFDLDRQDMPPFDD